MYTYIYICTYVYIYIYIYIYILPGRDPEHAVLLQAHRLHAALDGQGQRDY